MSDKLKVGILGGTGMVGQRFITLLENHPWFDVVLVAASGSSAGRLYEEAVEGRWKMQTPMPEFVKKMSVYDMDKDFDEIVSKVDFVFCAVNMPKDEIKALEERYAKAEVPVVSNNSANRWTPDVPMILPEVNPEHTKVIEAQKKRLGTTRGFIAVKPNCSIQSYAPALAALREFEPKLVVATTYQAISGAGKTFEQWPEMVENIIPYIGGEEEKSEKEPLRILGKVENGEIVPLFKPQWFLAENVGGLRNANEGRAFTKILTELRETGYTITPHLYKFEEYGIPQARHRIIIVGVRNDIDVTFRVPSTEPYKGIDNSCRTAIENPPIPENAPNNERTRQSEMVIRRLQHILPGQNAFTADLPEDLQLNIKGARISQIYKRLDPDKPSYTVTGSGGGGTHIYHWEEPRALTNRERARLQTFPDTYVFQGSKESVRKQIGMAVPCRGAQIIFEAILKSFAGIEYSYTEANINE